jgi:hypothetical protein
MGVLLFKGGVGVGMLKWQTSGSAEACASALQNLVRATKPLRQVCKHGNRVAMFPAETGVAEVPVLRRRQILRFLQV